MFYIRAVRQYNVIEISLCDSIMWFDSFIRYLKILKFARQKWKILEYFFHFWAKEDICYYF